LAELNDEVFKLPGESITTSNFSRPSSTLSLHDRFVNRLIHPSDSPSW
jgi:hypothetical protein